MKEADKVPSKFDIPCSQFDTRRAKPPHSLVPILLSILSATIDEDLDKRMGTEE